MRTLWFPKVKKKMKKIARERGRLRKKKEGEMEGGRVEKGREGQRERESGRGKREKEIRHCGCLQRYIVVKDLKE